MKALSSVQQLSDKSLLDETVRLAATERGATVCLIAAIAEVDARRLYLGESCASMFVYCTRVLHLSEHAAYDRIEVARLARRLPTVLEQLASGSLTLTNLRLLAPHLTSANVEAFMKEAAHQSKHEVELLIARLRPSLRCPRRFASFPRSPGVASWWLTKVSGLRSLGQGLPHRCPWLHRRGRPSFNRSRRNGTRCS